MRILSLRYDFALLMIRDDLALAVRRALADAALPGAARRRSCSSRPSSGIAATGPPPSPSRCRRRWAGTRWRSPSGSSAALEAADVPHLARVEVAKPGFVNLYLAPTWLHDVLRTVVDRGRPVRHLRRARRPTDQPRVRLRQPHGPAARGRRALGRGRRRDREPARGPGRARAPRVLPQRHRQPARDVPRLAVRAVPTASSRPKTATRASTSSTSRPSCAPSSATT